jgi:hypothetical protein
LLSLEGVSSIKDQLSTTFTLSQYWTLETQFINQVKSNQIKFLQPTTQPIIRYTIKSTMSSNKATPILMLISSVMIPSCFTFSFPQPHHHLNANANVNAQKHAFVQSHARSTTIPTSLYSTTESSDIQPGIDIINTHNPSLHQSLSNLRAIPYFRYYSVDMLASCEYMPQELFECYTETCEIYPVDEIDDETGEEIIPPTIRKLDIQEFDFDIDGWARWDMPSDDYYDITDFQEEFTAYDGSEVWKFIHTKIAFELEDDTVLHDSWKQDFNKAVSGMHSMISAHIVQGIQAKIDNGEEFDEECQWTNPQQEYIRRLSSKGSTPHAIENMYFTFMLLLSAVQSSREYLLSPDSTNNFGCMENDTECDMRVSTMIQSVLSSPLLQNDHNSEESIDINQKIGVAFSNLHDHAIKDEQSKHNLWEARMRSRELLRIMNCVQCNKCRLHGKIAAMGLSTALQLLLGKSGNGIEVEDTNYFKKIHRVELAALLTTLEKFSNAIEFCVDMEAQISSGGDSDDFMSDDYDSSDDDGDDGDDDDDDSSVKSGNIL